MAIKVYKPTTPGRRSKASVVSQADLTSQPPVKRLTAALKSKAGRSKGKITVRHRGGGAKRRYRMIDFKMNRFDEPALVTAIEYDPSRNSRIALLEYPDKSLSYVIAAAGMQVGDKLVSSRKKIRINIGNRMPLGLMPAGLGVYNIELQPGTDMQIRQQMTTRRIVYASESLDITKELIQWINTR